LYINDMLRKFGGKGIDKWAVLRSKDGCDKYLVSVDDNTWREALPFEVKEFYLLSLASSLYGRIFPEEKKSVIPKNFSRLSSEYGVMISLLENYYRDALMEMGLVPMLDDSKKTVLGYVMQYSNGYVNQINPDTVEKLLLEFAYEDKINGTEVKEKFQETMEKEQPIYFLARSPRKPIAF